jgi:hypothetical protein
MGGNEKSASAVAWNLKGRLRHTENNFAHRVAILRGAANPPPD